MVPRLEALIFRCEICFFWEFTAPGRGRKATDLNRNWPRPYEAELAGRIVEKALYLPSALALYYGYRECDLATRSPVWMSSVTRSN